MTRIPFKTPVLLLLVIITSGCCARRQPEKADCPPYISGRIPVAVAPKKDDATVSHDFTNLPSYLSSRKSILGQIATDSFVRIDLPEVIELAAKNSELADLIESERHTLKCQADSCEASSLDLILRGEALEHRNMAAASAAEVFLGLSQVMMQMELLEESKSQISKLQKTVAGADEAGFATAEGKNEISKAEIRVKKYESELNAAFQKLTYQLNLLINIDEQNPMVFQPIHHLAPEQPTFDVRQEVAIAESTRPGIRSLQLALAQGGNGDAIYKLLGIFDSRIGLKLPVPPIPKRLLRAKLIENLRAATAADNTVNNRKQQAHKVLDTRKKQARVAAGEAMLNIQTAFEEMTLINEDITRLANRQQVLTASQEIDAMDAYLEQHKNWVELQQAKSDRVVAAIKFETQKIKLLEAQGLLVDQ